MCADRTVLSADRINLERVQIMIVDDNAQTLDILGSVIAAFGVRNITKCQSAKQARELIGRNAYDLIVTDAQMPEETGYDFLRWLRNEATEPNKTTPALLCTGHTRLSQVTFGRDCGAHFVVAKPITPKILLERIFWIAREDRSFIECDAYVGPDRRFKRMGPPAGTDGRRKDDMPVEIGLATEPNLSQDQINDFLKPAKVSI